MLSRSTQFVLTACVLSFVVVYFYQSRFSFNPGKQHVSSVVISGVDQVGDSSVTIPSTYADANSATIATLPSKPASTPTAPTATPLDVSAPQPERLQSSAVNDVLLIIKTGADTIWKRIPMHLATTLSHNRYPNFAIYSDVQEPLTDSISTIDILANETATLQKYDGLSYVDYLDLHSPAHVTTYREHANLPGDEVIGDASYGGGWNLDRFKFIPMLAHAYTNWPSMKWYIYIEDDTYLILDNILAWLETLDPAEPAYYGSPSFSTDVIFPQGGSGVVFSSSLMQLLFSAPDPLTLAKYGESTYKDCCGDHALGNILVSDYGFELNNGSTGNPGFQPDAPWGTAFSPTMWCEPVFTFHHLHARDLITLSELERKHGAKTTSPLQFRDVYMELVFPYLHGEQPMIMNWDNGASMFVLREDSLLPPQLMAINETVFLKAWEDPYACQAACRELEECWMWRYENEMGCLLDFSIRLGRETDRVPGVEKVVTSGWMMDRVKGALVDDKCKAT